MTDSIKSPSSAAPDQTPVPSASTKKPRFALFVATAAGLGYIPVAPGTWGSFAGLALAALPLWLIAGAAFALGGIGFDVGFDPFLSVQVLLLALTAALGVWSANRAANFWDEKDPQRVVIDEVSGQHLTLVVGCGLPSLRALSGNVSGLSGLRMITLHSALNWKYLLLGLILFRVFDIWKPSPVRQAESLPGGWGIMADDWIAAIYAALGLWIARAAGL